MSIEEIKKSGELDSFLKFKTDTGITNDTAEYEYTFYKMLKHSDKEELEKIEQFKKDNEIKSYVKAYELYRLENHNEIKVELPSISQNPYNLGSEWIWLEIDEETKAAYKNNETDNCYYGTLKNNSTIYKKLVFGSIVPIILQGEKRPTVNKEWLLCYHSIEEETDTEEIDIIESIIDLIHTLETDDIKDIKAEIEHIIHTREDKEMLDLILNESEEMEQFALETIESTRKEFYDDFTTDELKEKKKAIDQEIRARLDNDFINEDLENYTTAELTIELSAINSLLEERTDQDSSSD